MKIYSDKLTARELYAAVPNGCVLELVPMKRPRTRRNGWTVRLSNPSSSRRQNTGTHGAGEARAASYQDHGRWMAALYELDPEAAIAHYTSREHFEELTRAAVEWGPHYAAPWLELEASRG